MINWFEKLCSAVEKAGTVIVVTVIAVRGSAPREIGAKILVTEAAHWGTIGGGNLEYRAISQARELLCVGRTVASKTTAAPAIHGYPLGPSLGQCCGGHMTLLFDWVDQDTVWFRHARQVTKANNVSGHFWLCRLLNSSADYRIVEPSQSNDNQFPSARQLADAGYQARLLYPGTASSGDSDGQHAVTVEHTAKFADSAMLKLSAGWWCEELNPSQPEVWVFGAGTVGRALHEQLQLLPCKSVAIDSRDEMLQSLPSSVRTISSDCGVAEVESAPAGAWFLVMTHSHALDFDLCYAVLKRTDFAYLGLIGSATKRATFVKRLAHRGIVSNQIDRLISPIGLTTIKSRLPQLIALGVATDLALQWQELPTAQNASSQPLG